MQITDLEGRQITVTDLDKAIQQAETFRHFRHENPEYRTLDEILQQYWNDLYIKLLCLKEQTVCKSGIIENNY